MSQDLTIVLLGLTGLASGVVAGIFFAFSSFIMTALARIAPAQAIAAMQAINVTILGSAFMPLFFGSTLAGLLLGALPLLDWRGEASLAMLAGGLVYGAGMFLCTVLCNVPLNRELAVVEAEHAESVEVWRRYLRVWTMWNHVRSLASLLACALFLYALWSL